jgi:hypothetical protein
MICHSIMEFSGDGSSSVTDHHHHHDSDGKSVEGNSKVHGNKNVHGNDGNNSGNNNASSASGDNNSSTTNPYLPDALYTNSILYHIAMMVFALAGGMPLCGSLVKDPPHGLADVFEY